ncbi:MAG: FixH family protein [Alteromonadaceae bacterium]|nr:FixH family protein [Alteromonadaceae bacterium]
MLLLLRKTRIIKKISLSFILMLTLLANNQSFAFTSFAKTQASESLTIAVEMLTQANSAQTESRQLIVKANKVRKQIKNLRVQMLKDKSSNDKLNQDQSSIDKLNQDKSAQMSQLNTLLKQSQKKGAELRIHSKLLKQQATSQFEQGFIDLWQGKIISRSPLTMNADVKNYFSHNVKIRSVHKKKLNLNKLNKIESSPENNIPENKITKNNINQPVMSLEIPAISGQNAPSDLNIDAFKFSRKEKYFAHIEVHHNNAENEVSPHSANVSAVPLNKIHQWRLFVTDLAGTPVEGINFDVEGHMPGHVHGLPTKPRVTKELEPGVYLVDGMKFQMEGWWVIKFILPSRENKAEDQSQSDFFIFNLVL